jgi:23S rRNA (cytosine1962-C5)-methyltransferase
MSAAFRSLRNEAPFDVVTLDPPAFAKSSRDVKAAENGYREIHKNALALLKEGGFLITSSCSYHLTEERFLELLRQAGRQMGRSLRLVERRTQGRDHPIVLHLPESHYLKCLILQAC